MNFFKKLKAKKILASAMGLGLILFALSARTTHAVGLSSLFNIADFSYTVIGKIAFAISYAIAFLAGIFIGIEAWLIGVVLNMNTGVFSSTVVTSGFSVTLAIANLGFVLGIIVIALATILRSESYGMKKLLWKLVAAAILVNFSLVIAAPIFNFGNSLTQYFVNCIDPTNGGCNNTTNGLSSTSDFAKNLAGAFNPQKGVLSMNNINSGGGSSQTDLQGAFSADGQDLSKMLLPIASILFVGVQLAMIVIVLGVLIGLLIMRYLYIAILAILMPFAWLMWIFPKTEHHWSKWWEEFIRWTFFSPIVVFFLWLAITTMAAMNNATATGSQSFATYTSNSYPLFASISEFFGNLITPIVQNFLNMLVMIGLSIAGMVVANSMGIKGAGVAVDSAKWVGGQVSGYAGKQTKKGARLAYQKAGGEKLNARLKEGRIGVLGRIPLAKRGASLAGRGISSISTNEEIVKDAQKHAPKSWEEAQQNLKGSMNMEDQFAHIAVGIKEGKIKTDDLVNGKKVRDIMDDKALIDRYHQGGLLADFNKVTMSNVNSRNAQRAAENKKAEAKVGKDIKDENGVVIHKAGDSLPTDELRKAADKEMYESAAKADFTKANVNALFGPAAPPDEVKARAQSIAEFAPQIAATLMRTMKSPALKRFASEYPKHLDALVDKYTKLEASLAGNTTGELEEATAKLKTYTAAQEQFDKTYKNIFAGAERPEPAAGAGAGGGGGGGGDKGAKAH